MLEAHGPGAAHIAGLWWFMLAMATGVYLIVLGALVVTIARSRRDHGVSPEARSRTADHGGRRWIIAGGLVLPVIVLTTLLIRTLQVQSNLEQRVPAALTIQVIGRMWWWEVRYPAGAQGQAGQGGSVDSVVTANELHIPTGARVRVELTSADVIHSLWVPSLQGKTDLVPGRTTITWLQADDSGTYRGQCAEYCGVQHTHMGLLVVAEPPEQFARWLADQRRPGVDPPDEQSRHGQDVFLRAGCGYCHHVRGLRTVGLLGPDLTHFASRRTIAAGMLANTRENLRAWIADPQHLKPGNRMPQVPLVPADLDAVVSYLAGLR